MQPFIAYIIQRLQVWGEGKPLRTLYLDLLTRDQTACEVECFQEVIETNFQYFEILVDNLHVDALGFTHQVWHIAYIILMFTHNCNDTMTEIAWKSKRSEVRLAFAGEDHWWAQKISYGGHDLVYS